MAWKKNGFTFFVFRHLGKVSGQGGKEDPGNQIITGFDSLQVIVQASKSLVQGFCGRPNGAGGDIEIVKALGRFKRRDRHACHLMRRQATG
jgi:hypothetical protein